MPVFPSGPIPQEFHNRTCVAEEEFAVHPTETCQTPACFKMQAPQRDYQNSFSRFTGAFTILV
jgi:hypothetical protein